MPSRTSGCARAPLDGTKAASSAAASTKPRRASAARPSRRGRLDDGAHQQQHAGGQRHRARDVVAALGVRGRPGRAGCSAGPANSTSAATGTGSRNVQRQPTLVSSPPKISPNEKPLAPNAVKIASALLRAGPSVNVVVMIESAPAR